MAGSKDQLASSTLAELYFRQGDLKKALEVLGQVLAGNPGDLKARELKEKWEKEWFRQIPSPEKKEFADKLARVIEIIRKEREGK